MSGLEKVKDLIGIEIEEVEMITEGSLARLKIRNWKALIGYSLKGFFFSLQRRIIISTTIYIYIFIVMNFHFEIVDVLFKIIESCSEGRLSLDLECISLPATMKLNSSTLICTEIT